MGRIYTRKQFSDYLGENRAILDTYTNYISGDTLTDLFVIPIGGVTQSIWESYISPQDEIFLTGSVTLYGNCSVNPLLKLKTDGSIFPGWTGVTMNTSGGLRYITPSSDGQNLYLSGSFTIVNGQSSNQIVKIDKDTGQISQTYSGAPTSNVFLRRIVEDGDKLVIPGLFTQYDGFPRSFIVRLNSDGSVDETIFTGTTFNNQTLGTIINNNGNYVCWGTFTTYSGVSCSRLCEINSITGELTNLFGTGITGGIPQCVTYDDIQDIYYVNAWDQDMTYQSQSGRMLKIDGTGNLISVHSINFWGCPHFDKTNNIFYGNDDVVKKLDLDTMTLDTQFTTNQGTWIGQIGTGLNSVKQINMTSKNKLIVVGTNFYFINGIQSRMIASFNLDGTPNMIIGQNCQ